jgi:hypothetical protein
MSSDARLGVAKGYKDGGDHTISMVGSLWFSIIVNESSILASKIQTVYFSYGYGPNEIPQAAAASGQYPKNMIGKTPIGTTVALLARPVSGISPSFYKQLANLTFFMHRSTHS